MSNTGVRAFDTFRFGSAQTGWGYGRILLHNIEIYIEVLQDLYIKEPKIIDWEFKNRLVAGWTHDARLYSGQWEIVGNIDVSSPLSFPSYKVRMNGEIWVTDVFGNIQRQASNFENDTLEYKFTTAPIRFENAFWDFHSGEWSKKYDRIVVSR